MICQRSGLCCVTMDVVVLVIKENGEKKACLKRGGFACPHLSLEGDQASCAVHELPEYEHSPCWIYGNPDVDPDFAAKRGRPCPVGVQVKKAGGLHVLKPEAMHDRLTVDDLEVLGDWP